MPKRQNRPRDLRRRRARIEDDALALRYHCRCRLGNLDLLLVIQFLFLLNCWTGQGWLKAHPPALGPAFGLETECVDAALQSASAVGASVSSSICLPASNT